ncbi:MAG TPA: c-type cytochrome [Trichocoleus sp.]
MARKPLGTALLWGIGLILVGLTLVWQPAAVLAEPVGAPATSAAQLFELHCAGCHPGGGNIVRRGKTLKQKALARNKVDTEDAIASLIYNGKGIMSAFGNRLSEAEIESLAHYVLEQAAADWK